MAAAPGDGRDRPGTVARRGAFASRARRMFERAMADNLRAMAREVDRVVRPTSRVLDVGCWDGASFRGYWSGTGTAFGFDRSPPALAEARGRDLRPFVADVERPWPVADDSIDVVTSNQVIEHVLDTDHFASECRRVLRPGGTAVVSTENLASWHNIAALLLGWQPFSITNVSGRRASIGNPLSNLRHADPLEPGWQHVKVFAHRGLVELFEAVGFSEVRIAGAGYYPLPAVLGRVDPRHAAFITVIARLG